MLPAMVNKSKNAAGQLLVMEHNDAGSFGWFFNDQLQFNANEKTIRQLPKV